jgi:thiol-disulfide isomerase/thioredoxin
MKRDVTSGAKLELFFCGAMFALGAAGFGSFHDARASASAAAAQLEFTQDMGIPVGSVAPPAALQRLDGSKVNLSEYYGKQPVLIEFWATWCPNCKALEPALKAAKEKYGDRMKFLGVAVTVNQSIPRVKAYMEQYKIPLEMLWDIDGKAVEMYEVPATSFVVIVNKEGKIAYGGLGSDQKLDEAIRKILP